MHITVILVVMLKSAILLPKNSMCPILPLNKNYLRNYLEPKNYLEVPEWQDDSWSGNCSDNSSNVEFSVKGIFSHHALVDMTPDIFGIQ